MIIPDRLRIRFKSYQSVASADQKAFTDWESKQITMKEAIERISANNGVDITPEQFTANAEMLGYKRPVDYDPDYDVIEALPYRGELRRFSSVSGVPFSAIYIGDKQRKVITRKGEQAMVDAWIGTGGKY